jgi:hypothetical protein
MGEFFYVSFFYYTRSGTAVENLVAKIKENDISVSMVLSSILGREHPTYLRVP